MWAMGTRGMVFYDIEKEYIRISDDRYIKRELFRISDEEIEQIESVICQKMKNNFLSLINFEVEDYYQILNMNGIAFYCVQL